MIRTRLALLVLAVVALAGCSAGGGASSVVQPVPASSTMVSPSPEPASSSRHVLPGAQPARDASAAAGATISESDSLAWKQASVEDRSPELATRLADGIVANGSSMDEVKRLLGAYTDSAVPADSHGQETWAYPVGKQGMLYLSFRDYRAMEYRTEGFDR